MSQKIELVEIAEIRVANPRVRDKRKFAKVVESIRNVGLKKPIQVSPRVVAPGEPSGFDLVCGQGRMEAFQALGFTEIPAIVVEVSREEGMLMSLIENMARRNASPVELADEISRLKKLGYSNVAIGKKLDISDTAVGQLLKLGKAGEGRLIYEVMKGNVPLSVAIEIARVENPDQQREFLEAYQKENLNQAAIRTIRRVVLQRDVFGRELGTTVKGPRCTSAEGLVNTLKKEGQRQKLLIKKTKVCESRMVFTVEAMRRLFADEDFVTLLRAEKVETVPQELSEMMGET
ncbi:ParB/RepB/Spo0J family partition protein [Luteolibacter sp. GHJ8]|uniref:ParB/RepB/Spo0J family partition protein n=1 Tax=Luteolibacter rhizosphaerae TaxID=2989719 RepID=A0ABT3G0A5_9BACT|nr:ParB/RepB/Spo0J family partition protein [Luteolibacter rhizosphaerae]MCW1912914.1 ParB/RepB/Spo0J family partition protein [Luteolibacter rhizosphaerae]